MKTKILSLVIPSAIVGALMITAASANIIAPPSGRMTPIPGEQQTLTGTLAWKTIKHADGTQQKGTTLQLTTPEKKVIELLPAEPAQSGQYDKFVGKTVEVKVRIQPIAKPSDQPVRIIKSIAEIKQPAKPKS